MTWMQLFFSYRVGRLAETSTFTALALGDGREVRVVAQRAGIIHN